MLAAPVASRLESPTLVLIAAAYGGWILMTVLVPNSGRGSPCRCSGCSWRCIRRCSTSPWRWMNDALAFPALGLLVPYQRFRDLHLAHHHDPTLTDPYDDPGYQLSRPGDLVRAAVGDAAVLAANNTLLGRMLIGPFVGMLVLWRTDAGLIASDHRAVARAWLLHVSRSFPSRHGSGSSAAFR